METVEALDVPPLTCSRGRRWSEQRGHGPVADVRKRFRASCRSDTSSWTLPAFCSSGDARACRTQPAEACSLPACVKEASMCERSRHTHTHTCEVTPPQGAMLGQVASWWTAERSCSSVLLLHVEALLLLSGALSRVRISWLRLLRSINNLHRTGQTLLATLQTFVFV